MEHTHIATRFDKDVDRIERLLENMADLVQTQFLMAMEALEARDRDKARDVVRRDGEINVLDERIDKFSVRLIALRQPMAEDLRRVVSTLKVASNLERIGDYAKTMALRVDALADQAPSRAAVTLLRRMTDLVVSMLDNVMQAYLEHDHALAETVRLRDAEVDQLNDALLREMLGWMAAAPENVAPGVEVLFIAKNLERAGDRVGNIAEQARFLITGEISKHWAD